MARTTRFRSVPYIAAGDAFISKAKDISVQDTRNMYVLATPNSKTQAALISYPGLKPWSTGGAVGTDRGIYRREFKGKGYHVAGTKLYSIARGGQRSQIGTIAGDERVSMIDNGNVLLIVGGGKMYKFDGTTLTTLNTVSQSGNAFVPIDVDYLNDKFMALADNGLIYVANVGETNFVNGFYEAESSPDSTIALKVFDQAVLNMGTDSIEPWQDVGTGSPPLSRVDGGIIENTGIANKNAVDITSEAVYFLGRDMIPYSMVNFLATKLTDQNPGIAELFREYDRDTSTVYALKWKGQEFIQFRFPVDKKVWVFSPNTGLWFQLDHGVNKELYRGGSTAFLFNKQIVADYESGSLYELDDDTHTNNGDIIVRERTFRPISGETFGVGRTALQMRSIQFLVETGVGVNDENPQMIVQYSIDGGRNYTNERWLRLGNAGDYVTVEDNSNRRFNDLVARIKYTEPTAFTIYNANIYVREAGRLIAKVVGSQVADNPFIPYQFPPENSIMFFPLEVQSDNENGCTDAGIVQQVTPDTVGSYDMTLNAQMQVVGGSGISPISGYERFNNALQLGAAGLGNHFIMSIINKNQSCQSLPSQYFSVADQSSEGTIYFALQTTNNTNRNFQFRAKKGNSASGDFVFRFGVDSNDDIDMSIRSIHPTLTEGGYAANSGQKITANQMTVYAAVSNGSEYFLYTSQTGFISGGPLAGSLNNGFWTKEAGLWPEDTPSIVLYALGSDEGGEKFLCGGMISEALSESELNRLSEEILKAPL